MSDRHHKSGLRIYAHWPSYLVFGVPNVVFLLALILITKDSGQLEILFLPLFTLILSLGWLARFRILVTPDELSYRSLFAGERTVLRSAIRRVKQTRGIRGPFDPYLRVEVEVTDGKPLIINAKVFNDVAIRELVQLLTASTKTAAAR